MPPLKRVKFVADIAESGEHDLMKGSDHIDGICVKVHADSAAPRKQLV